MRRLAAAFAISLIGLNIVFVLPSGADVQTLYTQSDYGSGYSRDAFKHWIDSDKDGCNTRYEVLIEEAIDKPRIDNKCKLFGGSWISIYDGKKYSDFSKLDIDHLVPLAEAWRSGAWNWTPRQRENFANDLELQGALLAVTASLNRSKGDKDVANWMPKKKQCKYVKDWIQVKLKYQLAVDPEEAFFLKSKISDCSIDGVLISVLEPVGDIPSTDLPLVSPKPSSALQVISPGAFCAEVDAGKKGVSSSGTIYTCKTSITENRLRWRR